MLSPAKDGDGKFAAQRASNMAARPAKSQSSQNAGSRVSDKYPWKSAHASTPTKTTRPPVLVVSPQSDIRKVEVITGRRQSRSPRATRRPSRSPRRLPRHHSPRRLPVRSYGEYRRNRSPNRRRRDSPRRHRDDRSRRGTGKVAELHRLMTTRHDRLTHQLVRGRHSHSAGDTRGDTALNVQHREFRSSHSERLQREEGAQPEVAISQRKAKKKSRDKERITKFRQKKQEEALAQQYGQETFGPAYHGPHEDTGPHFYEVPVPEGRLWSIPLTSLPVSQSISSSLCTSPRLLPHKQLRLR